MKNRLRFISLLCIPVGLMSLVHLTFAALSITTFNDKVASEFFTSAILLLPFAIMLLTTFSKLNFTQINYRDALIFSTFTWVAVGMLGAIPILLITDVSFTDAVFESISATTTTGATILSNLDQLPKTFLLYRQFLQWMGGLGIVIFVISVLPMLNSGGLRLLRAETPGPFKDDKLSPRILKTAHYLLLVYVALTICCAITYKLLGMSFYDAIAHSLTTISTGGFSTHDASMGYFHNINILYAADFFMLLGAINFGLHFRVIYRKQPELYMKDEETRGFLLIVLVLSVIIALILVQTGNTKSEYSPFDLSTFHLISFITSTGYVADNISIWPSALITILLIAGYLGGCGGSTAGGNKIVRSLICLKLINREAKLLTHPNAVFPIKYRNKPVEKSIISSTLSFMTITAFLSVILTLVLMTTGLDFLSALSAITACVNVLGPGFGELASNFQPVSDAGTWILSGAMILGRLEYFTVLVLFLPGFWKF